MDKKNQFLEGFFLAPNLWRISTHVDSFKGIPIVLDGVLLFVAHLVPRHASCCLVFLKSFLVMFHDSLEVKHVT